MTRILYWNIQQFGINKINNPSRKRQLGSSVNSMAASIDRRALIMSTIAANLPDIIVVVETSTGAGAEGTLISAGGQTGALDLLVRIRGAHGPNWMLVPPLILGQGGVKEGISVYYNSAVLNFTGPFGWQGGANPSAATGVIGIANMVEYPAPWYIGAGNANNVLPAGNTPGTAGIINPFMPMSKLAGQWLFHDNALPPNQLQFPGIGNRPPFLTTFWDPVNNRNIKLLSYHAPPDFGPAANGTNALSNIQEMTTDLGAQDVGVIVGDFNVDIFNALFSGIAYNNLTNPAVGGYTRQINPTGNFFPDKSYVCTHIKTSNQAKPWTANGYPGYEYIGSNTNFPGYDSIDNILTRYGAAAGGPAANMTIINRVSGSPYNRVMPTPGGSPAGHYVYPTDMQPIIGGALAGLPVALPLPPNGPGGNGGYLPGTVGALKRFKGWDNYGKIRSTSDHLPLIIDV